MVDSLIFTLPFVISCLRSFSNFCKVITYPLSSLSSSYRCEVFTPPLPNMRILSDSRRQYRRNFEDVTGRATTESFILPSGRKYRSNAPVFAMRLIKAAIREKSSLYSASSLKFGYKLFKFRFGLMKKLQSIDSAVFPILNKIQFYFTHG